MHMQLETFASTRPAAIRNAANGAHTHSGWPNHIVPDGVSPARRLAVTGSTTSIKRRGRDPAAGGRSGCCRRGCRCRRCRHRCWSAGSWPAATNGQSVTHSSCTRLLVCAVPRPLCDLVMRHLPHIHGDGFGMCDAIRHTRGTACATSSVHTCPM